jgi:hypothetical protein
MINVENVNYMDGFEIHRATESDFEEIQCLFKKLFDVYPEDQDTDYPYAEAGV